MCNKDVLGFGEWRLWRLWGERSVRMVMLFTACRCGWFERWEDCARGVWKVEVCVTVRLGMGVWRGFKVP